MQKSSFPEGTLRRTLCAIRILLCCLPALTGHADDWKDSQISDIKERASAAIQHVDGIGANLGPLAELEDFVDRVRQNRQAITGDMRDLLEMGREEIEAALIDQAAGLDAFLGGNDCGDGSPCRQFKQNIVALFANIQLANQTLMQLGPLSRPSISLDLQILADIVEAAPGRTIYPLYVGLNSSSNLFDTDLSDYFTTVVEALQTVRSGIAIDDEPAATVTSSAGERVDTAGSCPLIMETITPERFETAQRVLFHFSLLSKAVAKILIALGDTAFEGMMLGIHGYIGGNITNNPLKRTGLTIEGVADGTAFAAAHAGNMLSYCTIVANQQQVLRSVQLARSPGGPLTRSR